MYPLIRCWKITVLMRTYGIKSCLRIRDRQWISNRLLWWTNFQTTPIFFKEHPNALRLHFYEDEFEVVNPLGSKRTKHKLCAFYYTVGNLDKKYRSQQRHINLALLVRYSYVKQCGLNVILKPMLDDLKKTCWWFYRNCWWNWSHSSCCSCNFIWW